MLRLNIYLLTVCVAFSMLYQVIIPKNIYLQRYGNFFQILIPVSVAGLCLVAGDYEGVGLLAEGAIYSQESTEVLKRSIAEKRPNGANHLSFPSGHTMIAMNGAAFVTLRYGALYGVPATILAAVVGYSRVNANQHYWHDVFASTLIALLIQFGLMRRSKRKHATKNKRERIKSIIINLMGIAILCSIPWLRFV